MTGTIQRAVVIGSGTMGGGIAAHFANAGIPVYLLDVSQQIVSASFERMKKSKPAAFFTPETAALITIGALDEHEAWIGEANWVIEAIIEQLDAKRSLVERIDRLRKPDSIVSSNTSGLPIAKIAAGASASFKANFLGTHFFNPPRYMKLLEIIPTADTKPAVVAFVREFAERRLGKGVVLCKDTPNFIANRLGSISGATLLDFVLSKGYTIEETDAIAGPLIGRPKTAAFRLQDLVGLDVAASVGTNLYGLIEGDESREVLRSPHIEKLRKNQMERGRLGDKTGQGFYKKDGKSIQTLDLDRGEYRERREPQIASIAEAMNIRGLPERLAFVLKQDDKAGALARHVIYKSLAYAARRVPEISDELVSVDRAMRWGFSHDLGPFELWESLGVRGIVEEMKKSGIAVAPWVTEMLASGHETFYRDGKQYDPVRKAYVPIAADPNVIRLSACRVVRENKSASLRDLGDGVLCFEIHTKMNTLDDDVRTMLVESIGELERGAWKGMVIGNEGNEFCVGANLKLLSADGSDGLNRAVKAVQDAFMAVRFCAKPIVAAPFGRTLGGGTELSMSAARIVAASETYMGLPEVGVGVVPGAGGCKELVRRIVSPVLMRTPNADPFPLLQNVMQTVGMAKVSTSAEEARSFGFLGDADRVVMNRDHLIAEAKREVLELAATGYAAPPRENDCYAAGRDVRAAICAGIYGLQQGAYMSEYDALISKRLASILCGGDLSSGQWVSEQFILDLEREVFVALCREPKTQERIQAMLATGKPVRN
ncbi:MAG TPA: 3-hydroxyacyl-CoA dehydrogenase/enoyl-CoA hydratase family protein [Thermoanaerobaculia bacterium]|nr:3-hydroxyacyl-CoA dehydrogenase/enoyl-CoA hydratase family protein [Thermoanaerobaculia bacterium]